MGIIGLVEDGELELVASDVLLFETRRNPRSEHRAYAMDVLDKANAFIEMSASIRERSAELERNGLKPLDALHLATAEAAEVLTTSVRQMTNCLSGGK